MRSHLLLALVLILVPVTGCIGGSSEQAETAQGTADLIQNGECQSFESPSVETMVCRLEVQTEQRGTCEVLITPYEDETEIIACSADRAGEA